MRHSKMVARVLVTIFLVAGLVLPMAGTAGAGGSSGPCVGFIGPNANGIRGQVVPVADANTGPFYVDVRDVASDEWTWSIWVYQESGRKARLQRGGDGLILPPDAGGSDDCVEDLAVNRDLIVF